MTVFVVWTASCEVDLQAHYNALQSLICKVVIHKCNMAVCADMIYLGSLQANSRQTRLLLVGSMGVSQSSVLDPNVDPVHMAISYGKPLEGCKQALVIIPGELFESA